jgi:K+ transporter
MTTCAMARWRLPRASVRIKFEDFFTSLKLQLPSRVGTAVFMTQDAEGTPMALLHQLKHNQCSTSSVLLTILSLNELTAESQNGKRDAAARRFA